MNRWWTFDALNLASLQVTGATRQLFGQPVAWREFVNGGRHVRSLERYRQQGDARVDELLELLAQEGQPLRAHDDLLVLAEQWLSDDVTLQNPTRAQQAVCEFYQYYSTPGNLPTWLDPEQIKAGQEVFLTYLPAIGLSLYYRSLVPGFSIPKVAAVIQRTGYLLGNSTRLRLMDTGALLAACLDNGLTSLLPGGPGWRAALQVRVLHAKVRRALLHKKSWDCSLHGIPINQEDLAATLLAFSINALVGVEFIQGFAVSRPEQEAFLALWRYIGWLMGVDTVNHDSNNKTHETLRPLDPCGPGWLPDRPDSIQHARAMMESFLMHLMQPDETSVTISHHLLRQGRPQESNNKTGDLWFYYRALQCRRFVGDPLADALKLSLHSNWLQRNKVWIFSTLLLWVARLYTWAAHTPLRRWLVGYHLKQMQAFYKAWREPHLERMATASQQDHKPSSDELPPGRHAAEKHKTCPFAMVAPPHLTLNTI